MGSAFDKRFAAALRKMIPKEHDDYEEIQYSDDIVAHVWSHDNGAGSFEIEAIVPHDSIPDGADIEGSTLHDTAPSADAFYDDVDRLIGEVVGDGEREIVFQLTSVADDGAWERDANVYSTFELTE